MHTTRISSVSFAPFKHAVDSVNSNIVAWSLQDMSNSGRTGAYPNWTADFGLDFGRHIADSIRSAKGDFPADRSVDNECRRNTPADEERCCDRRSDPVYIPVLKPYDNHRNQGKDIIDALKIATAKGG